MTQLKQNEDSIRAWYAELSFLISPEAAYANEMDYGEHLKSILEDASNYTQKIITKTIGKDEAKILREEALDAISAIIDVSIDEQAQQILSEIAVTLKYG